MADSVDRVFVHALNTVKKIPKTGALRPPSEDRLRLYGLYKQAMEGDVDGVMERPMSVGSDVYESENIKKDREKYDSWHAQRGLSRTEAKRKYVEALIVTMHKYANTTHDARALVDELEFVWDQIKHNIVSSNASSPVIDTTLNERFEYRSSANLDPHLHQSEGPMRLLSPKSQDDEIERDCELRQALIDGDEALVEGSSERKGFELVKWRKSVEQTLVKLTTEVAALREQIATGREYRGKKRLKLARWISWFWWVAVRHFFVDIVIMGIVLLWMRKRKDRRIEDLLRQALGVVREYVRKVLPSR
ncbi:putative acyl binding family protein [Golovinomyces cichoracearum]|uniref:Putative acyl binding family protein n=1 Tax=Golovinomyces cichoracearum TaxID=62708 RepID=A0A420ICD4_9PEZI|nr:putative acyl binding family protein [Golovinomyces cichoracearum]